MQTVHRKHARQLSPSLSTSVFELLELGSVGTADAEAPWVARSIVGLGNNVSEHRVCCCCSRYFSALWKKQARERQFPGGVLLSLDPCLGHQVFGSVLGG